MDSSPEKAEPAEPLLERDLDDDPVLQRVIASRRSELYADMTQEMLETTIADAELRPIIAGPGLSSAVVAPLVSREGVVGVLTVVCSEPGSRYNQSDQRFIEELARRAGAAIENARLYREAQRVQGELKLAGEAKDEFLGLLAHELRTPITTIYGGARFLNSHSLDLDQDTLRELLITMEDDAGKLSRMVENLLALARMEVGREIPREPVHVQHFLEEVVASYGRRHPRREVNLSGPGAPVIIEAGPTYLEQVIVNLLENSNKYSEPGKPIDIVAHSDEELTIAVLDRGPGIAEGELGAIFDSFYRSEKTAAKAPGKGLGLAVCKRLIEAHGGRVWAKARPGGGLEVGFALPLVADVEEDVPSEAVTMGKQ